METITENRGDPQPGRRSIAEHCLEELAHSEAELRDRVRDLEGERDIYRTIAFEAVNRCHELTDAHQRTVDRLRGRIVSLLAELRKARGEDAHSHRWRPAA